MFYTDDITTPVANTTTALQYQSYIRQFVTGHKSPGGYPTASGQPTPLIPDWPIYGQESHFFNITSEGFVNNPMQQSREETCQFLNRVVADPSNGA